MPSFDTHAVFTTLHTQGFSDQQATALTTALTTVTDALVTTAALTASQHATKADLETAMARVETSQHATRADVSGLRVLLESRLQTIDARFTFTHWMIGIAFTVLFGFSLGHLWLLINLLSRLPRP